MITVTNDFKTAQKAEVKQVHAILANGDDGITDLDDLKSIKISTSGNICKSIMRQAEAVYLGTHSTLGNTVQLSLGVVLEDDSTEYINYGSFVVTSVETNEATNASTIKMYDKMYDANQPYVDASTFPCTLADLLDDICTSLSWTLATTSFPNDDLTISSELFSESQLTYRQVLDMIAEATGSIIYFDVNDELTLKQVAVSGSDETLTSSDLFTLKLQPKFEELNSVVLSRMPQEDNIAEQDATSISNFGLHEVKIINNLIVDSDRETYITPIFNALKYLDYYPFEAKTVGLGYFQVGDRITLTDPSGNTYQTIILEVDISVSGGISEYLRAKTFALSSTNYDYAGIIGQQIKHTEIIVNKQEGEIALINETLADVSSIPRQAEPPESPEVNDLYLDTDDNLIYRYTGDGEDEGWVPSGISKAEMHITTDSIQSSVTDLSSLVATQGNDIDTLNDNLSILEGSVTTLEQESDALTLKVDTLGGTNLLKNSVGLKGSLDEWGGNGTVVQTSDVSFNTESHSAIQINNEAITQTVNTIVGNEYTFYCRFKDTVQDDPLDPTVLTVNGTDYELTGDLNEWTTYSLQFTAISDSTSITLTAGTTTTTLLSDMVVKIGTCNGWTQAPNEVYGANFKFDTEGLTITETDNNFKSVLDNEKLAVYDTSGGSDKVAMYVSKDAGMVTNLTAQDEFIVRQYGEVGGEVAKSARFIPTDTGLMIVIND